MSGPGQEGGEKTEQPTPKRLRDARRDGDVPKSRDLTQTATMLVWILLLIGLSGYAADRLSSLLEYSWTQVDLASADALYDAGAAAVKTLVLLTVLPLSILALCGILVEFLQTGAVFAPKRIAPQASRLNPADGFKRIFCVDNLFEIVKSLLKTALIAGLLFMVTKQYLPDILRLPAAGISAYVGLDRRLIVMLCVWTGVAFAFVSAADRLYQGYSHRKRLRMSKDEVRREHKQDEGDPQLRGHRQGLHRQWSTQNAPQAAREATALVVNPTHIAVAILYEPERTAVPTITAKGEGDLALLMRRAAEEAGVPVIRNIPLARALNFHCEEEDFIPEAYFDAVAEIIASVERLRRKP